MNAGFLPFALPLIGQDEINEVVDTLRSGWITTGPKTQQFEEAFKAYIGTQHALAVNSATAGLHLSLEAIGLQRGDRVAVPVMTFTSTAEVVRYFDAHPVFVDIDPYTLNLCPDALERICAEHAIKAVIPVHYGGQACDMETILRIAGRYGLKVIEDAAHALPATSGGRRIGTIGDLTVFSFYATKTLTTGEGGMITMKNDVYAARIRTMRLHGINRDVWDRYMGNRGNWYYEVVAPGFKYNLTDVAAAIGIHQLRKVDRFWMRRVAIAQQYNEALGDVEELVIPYITHPEDQHAWHLYVIQLNANQIRIDRDRFIEQMRDRGIGTSVHFIPLHLHPYYRDTYGYKKGDFPAAEQAYERMVSLPIYPGMSDRDVDRVIEAVQDILRRHRR